MSARGFQSLWLKTMPSRSPARKPKANSPPIFLTPSCSHWNASHRWNALRFCYMTFSTQGSRKWQVPWAGPKRPAGSSLRARDRVREARPRFHVKPEQSQRLVAAFLFAAQSGDAQSLKNLLTEDACFLSDGGGRVAAAGIPILGRERIAKVLLGLIAKHGPPADAKLHLLPINGQPGCVIRRGDGMPIQTVALEVDSSGLINAIYVVRNPEKLRHLAKRSGV